MADKDLLVIIAEMLRKQDQHTEILKQQSKILEQHSVMMAETNTTLKQLIEISVHQFQIQHQFNERQQQFNERQQEFNEAMLGKVDNIEKTMIKSINLEDRIQRLETAVFKAS